jgi:NAD(P)-dependent dehydrogenase (short-subunit alcohol dehydrogenase family)
MKVLEGQVAVVAGATRGAGRGIARALGEAGAVVYCTGRSVPGRPSPYARPETIDETAALIAAAGGTAIPVRVDHTVERKSRNSSRKSERGRLDVLVSSIAGEDPLMTNGARSGRSTWARAKRSCARPLVPRHHRQICGPPDGRRAPGPARRGHRERHPDGRQRNVLAQIVKLAHKALAAIFATELRPHGVAAVAITPGFLRSESMLDHFGVTEANWREGGKKDSNFLESESPLFVGRAVAALAGDANVMKRSGHLFSSWELAREFGFTDADGRRPDWGRKEVDFSEVPPALCALILEGLRFQSDWLRIHSDRTERYLERWKKDLRAQADRH